MYGCGPGSGGGAARTQHRSANALQMVSHFLNRNVSQTMDELAERPCAPSRDDTPEWLRRAETRLWCTAGVSHRSPPGAPTLPHSSAPLDARTAPVRDAPDVAPERGATARCAGRVRERELRAQLRGKMR